MTGCLLTVAPVNALLAFGMLCIAGQLPCVRLTASTLSVDSVLLLLVVVLPPKTKIAEILRCIKLERIVQKSVLTRV